MLCPHVNLDHSRLAFGERQYMCIYAHHFLEIIYNSYVCNKLCNQYRQLKSLRSTEQLDRLSALQKCSSYKLLLFFTSVKYKVIKGRGSTHGFYTAVKRHKIIHRTDLFTAKYILLFLLLSDLSELTQHRILYNISTHSFTNYTHYMLA